MENSHNFDISPVCAHHVTHWSRYQSSKQDFGNGTEVTIHENHYREAFEQLLQIITDCKDSHDAANAYLSSPKCSQRCGNSFYGSEGRAISSLYRWSWKKNTRNSPVHMLLQCSAPSSKGSCPYNPQGLWGKELLQYDMPSSAWRRIPATPTSSLAGTFLIESIKTSCRI